MYICIYIHTPLNKTNRNDVYVEFIWIYIYTHTYVYCRHAHMHSHTHTHTHTNPKTQNFTSELSGAKPHSTRNPTNYATQQILVAFGAGDASKRASRGCSSLHSAHT